MRIACFCSMVAWAASCAIAALRSCTRSGQPTRCSAPDVVRQIHRDYIAAGADVITTNTYGVIRHDLAKEGIEHRFDELNLLACALAGRRE